MAALSTTPPPHRPTDRPIDTTCSTFSPPHDAFVTYGLHNVRIGIPEEEADVNVRMPAKEFERIVKTLVEMGDHMTIAVSKGYHARTTR